MIFLVFADWLSLCIIISQLFTVLLWFRLEVCHFHRQHSHAVYEKSAESFYHALHSQNDIIITLWHPTQISLVSVADN